MVNSERHHHFRITQDWFICMTIFLFRAIIVKSCKDVNHNLRREILKMPSTGITRFTYDDLIDLFRGIVCGETNLSMNDLILQLDEASKNQFEKQKYCPVTNNCRDFCSHLIFDVLKPTNKENGKTKFFVWKFSKANMASILFQHENTWQIWKVI